MLLIVKDIKSYLRSLILSFWLVQNLSSLTEGLPTSGNDNHWNRVRYVSYVTAALILMFIITHPLKVNAGGYFITDKDGNVISESTEKIVVIGPTEKTIVLNDYNQIKVFEIQWDADEKTLIIQGDTVHLKIFRNGRVEKWSTFEESGSEQYPIFIEPIIPISPRHPSNEK
jgi:hypothetical protein